jgi:hypothetical protein
VYTIINIHALDYVYRSIIWFCIVDDEGAALGEEGEAGAAGESEEESEEELVVKDTTAIMKKLKNSKMTLTPVDDAGTLILNNNSNNKICL